MLQRRKPHQFDERVFPADLLHLIDECDHPWVRTGAGQLRNPRSRTPENPPARADLPVETSKALVDEDFEALPHDLRVSLPGTLGAVPCRALGPPGLLGRLPDVGNLNREEQECLGELLVHRQ